MSIYSDIYAERLKITTIVHRDKLGKHIYQTILNPILEELYNNIDNILQEVGQTLINHLIELVQSNKGGGWTYSVWLIAPDGKNVFLGDYTASNKGGPPFSAASGIDGVPATGTLAASLMWNIDSDGRLIIGVGESAGTEFESSFYKWGKIFVGGNETTKTPVNVYAKALDDPNHPSYRPWLDSFIEENKNIVRQWIREQVGKAINEVTRRPTVKRALEIRIYWRSLK